MFYVLRILSAENRNIIYETTYTGNLHGGSNNRLNTMRKFKKMYLQTSTGTVWHPLELDN